MQSSLILTSVWNSWYLMLNLCFRKEKVVFLHIDCKSSDYLDGVKRYIAIGASTPYIRIK